MYNYNRWSDFKMHKIATLTNNPFILREIIYHIEMNMLWRQMVVLCISFHYLCYMYIIYYPYWCFFCVNILQFLSHFCDWLRRNLIIKCKKKNYWCNIYIKRYAQNRHFMLNYFHLQEKSIKSLKRIRY